LQRAQRLFGNRMSQQFVKRISTLQRQCACGSACSKCQEEEQGGHLVASAHAELVGIPISHGEPLDAATRRDLEAHFGVELSDVRVHTAPEAAASATKLEALAYAGGRDIYFASGMYAPANNGGRRLLAHEVVYVVQQSSGKEPSIATKSWSGVRIGAPEDLLETEADRAGEDFTTGRQPSGLTEEAREKRESSGTAQRFINGQGSARLIQREWLAGTPCTHPIPGAPGQCAARTLEAEKPARQAQAAQPAAQLQASGQGREAVNVERMAREAGYNLNLVRGIYVDLAIQAGGWTRNCSDFIPAYSGEPNARCIAFSDEMERGAELYNRNATANRFQLRGASYDRALFRTLVLQFVAYELGHARFGAFQHPTLAGTTCTRSTVIYTDTASTPQRAYDLNFYLSELLAIMSEFPPLYRGAAGGNQSVLDYVRPWFNYKVNTAAESIKGILTSLRCKCIARTLTPMSATRSSSRRPNGPRPNATFLTPS
jgi:hypothetical protein